MPINIIADSSSEMPAELKSSNPVVSVPFKLYIDEVEMVDDETLDVLSFIKKMGETSGVPRSACPAPNDFLDTLVKGAENFIVTISSRLSGTYNSAMLARTMALEEDPGQKIHVFDSKSASIGETLICLKIKELSDAGFDFDAIVDVGERYIQEMRTFFISESLDNLMKNGRISKLKGTLATALKIKPIMGSDDEGEIQLIDKVRGSEKAFQRLAEIIAENAVRAEEKILAISHVNNPERAEWLKKEIEARCSFKKVIVVQTSGLSSLYCDRQGIIVAF